MFEERVSRALGKLGVPGRDEMQALTARIEELNRQGYKVDGKTVKLEIVQADDKGTTDGAKAAAQQLIDQGVHVVFGHLASDVTLAAVPAYQAKGLTLVTTSSAKEITTQGGGNVFRLVASDSAQARPSPLLAAQTSAFCPLIPRSTFLSRRMRRLRRRLHGDEQHARHDEEGAAELDEGHRLSEDNKPEDDGRDPEDGDRRQEHLACIGTR